MIFLAALAGAVLRIVIGIGTKVLRFLLFLQALLCPELDCASRPDCRDNGKRDEKCGIRQRRHTKQTK